MKNFIRICLVNGLLFLPLTAVFAQPDGSDFPIGKLNVWTKNEVSRENMNGDRATLKKVKFARHKGFDRLVFEFEGKLPGYVVYYNENLAEECWRGLQISNKSFLIARFFLVSNAGETAATPVYFDLSRAQIKSNILREVVNGDCWTGDEIFAADTKKRTAFRVLHLSNPTRIVIDLKH